MTTQYLVKKIETCPVCEGERHLWNPHWQRINRENAEWGDENDADPSQMVQDWQRRVREQWPNVDIPPPEVEECHECEGEGKTETWIPLREAMSELAVSAASGPVHRAWCSCGKSTVAVWNPETTRYEAQDEGWVFSLDRNGWTCGQEDHRATMVEVWGENEPERTEEDPPDGDLDATALQLYNILRVVVLRLGQAWAPLYKEAALAALERYEALQGIER